MLFLFEHKTNNVFCVRTETQNMCETHVLCLENTKQDTLFCVITQNRLNEIEFSNEKSEIFHY